MWKTVIVCCCSMMYATFLYIPFADNKQKYSSFCKFTQFINQLCGTTVYMYGDEFIPDDNGTIICNHKSIYDILAMFHVCGHFNCIIGFCLKKAILYVPGCGKWCTYLKFPIMSRIKTDIQMLEQYKKTFPIVIYPEGTRFTTSKHKSSYDYAKQHDFPISKYAALPKSAGCFALSNGIVYKMTMIYINKNQQIMYKEVNDVPSRIYIHVKKYTDYPQTQPEYKHWLCEQFANIDDIYDNFAPNNVTKMQLNLQPHDYYIYIAYSVMIAASFVALLYLHL